MGGTCCCKSELTQRKKHDAKFHGKDFTELCLLAEFTDQIAVWFNFSTASR
jgi:hypothetical protein